MEPDGHLEFPRRPELWLARWTPLGRSDQSPARPLESPPTVVSTLLLTQSGAKSWIDGPDRPPESRPPINQFTSGDQFVTWRQLEPAQDRPTRAEPSRVEELKGRAQIRSDSRTALDSTLYRRLT